MSVFERIKELAKSKRITLQQLGHDLHLGSSTVYKWKYKQPNGKNLRKVAKYLGVTSDYLLGLNDEKPEAKHLADLSDDELNELNITTADGDYIAEEDLQYMRELAKVAKYLGVTTDYLLGLDSHQGPELKQKDLADLTNKDIDHLKISSNLGFVLSEKDQSFLLNFAKFYAKELRKKRDQKPKNAKD